MKILNDTIGDDRPRAVREIEEMLGENIHLSQTIWKFQNAKGSHAGFLEFLKRKKTKDSFVFPGIPSPCWIRPRRFLGSHHNDRRNLASLL